MAYQAFTPETRIEESQDGRGFKIFDKSVWNGESGNTSSCIVNIVYINDNEEVIAYDPIDLGGNGETKFEDYLGDDGCLLLTEDMTIDGVAADEIFPDGYYEITVTYNDGSYTTGQEPYYKNVQGFLAKYRCMKRVMPAELLSWPITEEVRAKNYDIYTLGLYLDAAEDAADLGKKVQFRKFIALIRQIVDYYAVPSPF